MLVHKDSFIAKARFGTTKSEVWYYKKRGLVLQKARFGTTKSEVWYYKQMFGVSFPHESPQGFPHANMQQVE